MSGSAHFDWVPKEHPWASPVMRSTLLRRLRPPTLGALLTSFFGVAGVVASRDLLQAGRAPWLVFADHQAIHRRASCRSDSPSQSGERLADHLAERIPSRSNVAGSEARTPGIRQRCISGCRALATLRAPRSANWWWG